MIRHKALSTTINKSRVVSYVPWMIQNNLVVFADSVAKIYTFEPKGSKSRSYPIRRVDESKINNIITKSIVKPLQLQIQPEIIGLNQNVQSKILIGLLFSVQVGDFIFDKSALAALKKISTTTNF